MNELFYIFFQSKLDFDINWPISIFLSLIPSLPPSFYLSFVVFFLRLSGILHSLYSSRIKVVIISSTGLSNYCLLSHVFLTSFFLFSILSCHFVDAVSLIFFSSFFLPCWLCICPKRLILLPILFHLLSLHLSFLIYFFVSSLPIGEVGS